jgi:hypothetical protein
MPTDMEELYMETVHKRFPQGKTISDASFWSPREGETIKLQDENKQPLPVIGYYVPRPDRNIGTLQNYALLGFLGLDHFYLRSPATGVAKLLTLGGFGFWWLWDILQLWTEENRVLKYGISTPFDTQIGIGQGMIYKGDKQSWTYEQNTDFGTWSLATLFGFMGADMFVLGRFWLGFRKLMIFFITMSALAPFFVILMSNGFWAALANTGFFGIFWDIFCFMLAIGVFSMWYDDVSKLFNKPDSIMRDGLPVSQTAVDSLGWISILYLDEDGKVKKGLEKEWQTISNHYMFHRQGIIAQELRGRFWIARKGEYPQSPFTPSPAGVVPFTLLSRIISSMWEGTWDNTVGWAWGQGEGFLSFIYKYAMIGLKFMGTIFGVADSVVQAIPLPVIMAGLAVPPLTVLEPAAPLIQPVVHGIAEGVQNLIQGKPLESVAKNTVSSAKSEGLGNLIKGAAGAVGNKGGFGGLVSGALGGKGGLGGLVSGAEGLLGGLTGSKESESKGKESKESKDSGNAEEDPGAVNTISKNQMVQAGGSKSLSTEAQVMGTVVVALIAGGSLKGLVDYLMTE